MKYKVGDKVRIKSLDWYNENKDENIDFNTPLVLQMTSKMSLFCDDVVTIKEVNYNYYSIYEDNNTFCWTDDMIEGLVEEETKPKFKVGDKIKLKSTLLNDIFGVIGYEPEGYRITNISNGLMYFMSYSIEHYYELVEEEVGLVDNLSCRWVNEFNLPDGYIFKDENGNVINATKIVLEKKKKEYPKTYCECKDILGLWDIDDTERRYYKTDLIDKLQMLLICRDAYWKIAGEEMGLDKPWEPMGMQYAFSICRQTNEVVKSGPHYCGSHTFEFPTEEMRDAFYENFKELIEQCKELL